MHSMVKKAAENLWRARFAWFWYNSKEILHFTQEDMDKKVQEYADNGYTHLITFSCTHFRWSFRPWWKEINECLRKIVVSAHKHGIKVIEHHSSNLTYYADEEKWPRILQDFRDINCDVEKDFPGFREFNSDWTKEHMQWCQQDAVTGEPFEECYLGYCRCPNYEAYMQEYCNYLKDVYATGVDGIMTDDMYAFFEKSTNAEGEVVYINRSCGCPNCRKLYKEMTSYDFPAPEKWDDWFGRMDDPSFIAFLKFRKETFRLFHTRIKEHYESLGLQLFRPNYSACTFNSNHAFGADTDLPALDLFFQECCYGHIIRYSWPRFLFEQLVVAGRCGNIPHMMMFYANDPACMRFVFGLAKIAGAMLTNTCMGEDPHIGEEKVRAFEDRYADWLFNTENIAYVTFIESQKNRNFSAGFYENRCVFWGQGSFLRNIPSRVQKIENGSWDSPILVLNEIRLLTEKEISDLKKYAENGGCLVLTGIAGEQDEDGRFRTAEELEKLWGIDLYDQSYAESYRIFPLGKGRLCRVGYDFGYPGGKELNYQRFVYDERRKKHNYISRKEELIAAGAPRTHSGVQEKVPLASYHNYYRENAPCYDTLAAFFEELAGEKVNFKTSLPDLILARAFYAPRKKSVAIFLLNAAGTLPERGQGPVAHDDPIPFPPWKEGDGEFRLTLPAGVKGEKAFFAPIEGEEKALAVEEIAPGKVKITLPAGLLTDCGLIRVE